MDSTFGLLFFGGGVYEQKEVEKTVSKMQEVIETTYLMMQESQKRLVR